MKKKKRLEIKKAFDSCNKTSNPKFYRWNEKNYHAACAARIRAFCSPAIDEIIWQNSTIFATFG